jgi:hypothetical protein
VFEHIQVQSFGQDSIKTLESLIKLKIKTMADGIAMTSFDGIAMPSFEQKMPRSFKKTTAHKVVKDDASHFDTIISYNKWMPLVPFFWSKLRRKLSPFEQFIWRTLTMLWNKIKQERSSGPLETGKA